MSEELGFALTFSLSYLVVIIGFIAMTISESKSIKKTRK